MRKLQALRFCHVLVMFFVICVFSALALYTYDETWFVGVAELVFYKLFGKAAVLADNFESLWSPLIIVTLLILLIEEIPYNRLYKKAIRQKNRQSMKHNKQPKQILIQEEEQVSKKELRAAKKAQELEAKKQAQAFAAAKAEEKRVAKEQAKAKVNEKVDAVETPVETVSTPTETEKVISSNLSTNAKLNALLKNSNKK